MVKIVQDGAPILREIAKPVPKELFGSAELARIIGDMVQALDKEPEGVALAAPQIGAPYRLFIVRADRTVNTANNQQPMTKEPDVQIYINPEIVKTSRKRALGEEGCLSTRGVYGAIKRHERVTISAYRQDGSRFTRGSGGIMAQVFEHEIGHLNGELFTDYAERLIRISPMQPNDFIFFGTPWVARDTLATLITGGLIPRVVVTAPDALVGRGLVLMPSETKTLALAHNILVLTPSLLDAEMISEIKSKGCEYAIVVAYGKIFPEELISAFPKGVLNVHYSLLPKHRGAIPVEAALLAGDSTTGVTIQKMAREIDSGDILAQEETAIVPNETARELRKRLVPMGARLLVATLPKYLKGEITLIAQDPSHASHAHKIKKEDGLLSLDASAEENWKKYRAYADSIGTFFFDSQGKRIKITRASLKKGKFIIERVIPEGKREMDYRA